MSTAEEIPDKIFTTTGVEPDPGIFSIDSSLAYVGMDGCVAQSENLYKVVSAAPIEDGVIAKLLGSLKIARVRISESDGFIVRSGPTHLEPSKLVPCWTALS